MILVVFVFVSILLIFLHFVFFFFFYFKLCLYIYPESVYTNFLFCPRLEGITGGYEKASVFKLLRTGMVVAKRKRFVFRKRVSWVRCKLVISLLIRLRNALL